MVNYSRGWGVKASPSLFKYFCYTSLPFKKMLMFRQWLEEEQSSPKSSPEVIGPEARWEKLIDLHRIQFTNRFAENALSASDRAFIVMFFETYKYSKQLPVGNLFQTKYRGCTFKLGFFKNQQWAASIDTENGRQVTEKFQVTESKISSLFQLFDKALKQQSFKDILPVVSK